MSPGAKPTRRSAAAHRSRPLAESWFGALGDVPDSGNAPLPEDDPRDAAESRQDGDWQRVAAAETESRF